MINKIKNNKRLYSNVLKITNRIPKKLYYPKSYFQVQQLLKKRELGDNIENILNRRLVGVIKNALQNVPFYQKLNLNIVIDDINEFNVKEYLTMFPFINKEIVMSNPNDFINQKYFNRKLYRRNSSGSTGRGMVVVNNLEEVLIEKAFYDYEWGKLGYKATAKVVRIGQDGIRKSTETPFSFSGDRLLISPDHLTTEWLSEIYMKIKDFKVEYFHAYPSALLALLQYMKKENLSLKTLKGVLLASEQVDQRILNLLVSIFGDGIPVHFGYGLTERTNLAWGTVVNGNIKYRCEEVYGYSENYIREDGYLEIVGTSYWNYVMPLIRYRTEDLGVIKDGYIQHLQGRAQDFLITKQGNYIPGITFDPDPSVWNYIDIFQIIQYERGKLKFRIVKKETCEIDIENLIFNSENRRWKEYFDIEIKSELEAERTKAGKIKMVINKLNLK